MFSWYVKNASLNIVDITRLTTEMRCYGNKAQKSSFIREKQDVPHTSPVKLGWVVSLKRWFQETEHFYQRPEEMDQCHRHLKSEKRYECTMMVLENPLTALESVRNR